MRILNIIVCIACLGTSVVVGGQQTKTSGKRRAVILPRDIALSAIVQQPDCPLRIMKFERLVFLDGGARNLYEVRNDRSQPIRTYYIAEVSASGTGNMFGRKIEPVGKFLMQGESDAPDYADDQIEVVPLTKQLREKLNLEAPLKAVMFFMVVRVEFADRTVYVYEDAQTKEALTTFFLDNPIEPQTKRPPLRD